MMHSVLLLLVLFQGPQDASTWQCPRQSPPERWSRTLETEFFTNETTIFQDQRNEAAYEERQFREKYNRLVHALVDFSVSYNAKHAVDVKKVKAVHKAWRELEKVEDSGQVDFREGFAGADEDGGATAPFGDRPIHEEAP